jgi:hypothetical protein
MKPFLHARSSAKKYGGKPAEYIDIHNFIDSSKAHHPDIRHRALFHSSLGCYLVEQIFGVTRVNSDGREYSPRDCAEHHIIEDLGKIPTVSDYLNKMEIEVWMSGNKKRTMVPFKENVD